MEEKNRETGINGDFLRIITRENNSLREKYQEKLKELLIVKHGLKNIFKINSTLSSNFDIKKLSRFTCQFVCELMRTDACFLLLIDDDKLVLPITAGYNFRRGFLRKLSFQMGEWKNGKLAIFKKPQMIYDISHYPYVAYRDVLMSNKFHSLLSLPLVYKKKTLGVISTFSLHPRCFTKEEIRMLEIFASQLAFAVQSSRYYENIRNNYISTIHTLVLAIEARDPFIHGHTDRVTKYALEIAKALKMSKKDIEILRYASEVHDIGKISIPDFILNKPAKLTPAERAIIELHPVKGEEMLEPLQFLKAAKPIVRHHHERYDGAGYPDGLKKEEIPFLSRIIACADSFDAMTSERPYRPGKMKLQEAIHEIRANSGTQFDPRVAQAFIKILHNKDA